MKNFAILTALLATASLPALAAPVPSLPSAGAFSVTPSIGTELNIGGDFVKSGSQSFAGAGTFGGAAVTLTGTVSADSQKFGDVYNTPLVLGLSGNYDLSNNDEVLGNFHWMHASGKNFDALTASASGTINGVPFSGSGPIQGKFSNYNEIGIDAGYRRFFDIGQQRTFHPYVGAMLGAAHTNDITLDLSAGGTSILSGINFYGSGWTWAGGIETGFRYDVAPAVAVGLETGIRYTGDLKTDSSTINASSAGGLGSVNHGGSRWGIPIMFGLTGTF